LKKKDDQYLKRAKKTEKIWFRLTLSEKLRLAEVAAAVGMSPSEFIRYALRKSGVLPDVPVKRIG